MQGELLQPAAEAAPMFGSTEFMAAMFGALAAFLFDAWMRWRERIRREQDAANCALLTLAQMYSHLENVRKQTYEDREAEIQQLFGRAPFPLEYLPLSVVSDYNHRLDMGSLSFLLRTHDPDVAARVGNAERCYVADVLGEAERAKLHVQVQEKLSAANFGAGTVQQVQQIVGMGLYAQLDNVTNAQRDGIAQSVQAILKAAEELHDVVSVHYPTRRFVRIKGKLGPGESRARRPPRLRRVVRAIIKAYRARMERPPLKLNR